VKDLLYVLTPIVNLLTGINHVRTAYRKRRGKNEECSDDSIVKSSKQKILAGSILYT
jgi:hypothetical protein